MDHAARRNRLLEHLADLDVESYLVSRLPNVRYLSGFTGSNGQLVLWAGGGVLLTDGRYTEQSRREVPDLERETYVGAFPPVFGRGCRARRLSRVGFEAEGITYQQYLELCDEGLELVPTRGVVEALRWVKDAEELANIRAAQAITDDAFDGAVAGLAAGKTERQVAAELESAMRRGGADGFAFEPIVAFGPSAAEPHHQPTDRTLARGQLVKMDFGALVAGYHADMTRTVAFGAPSEELREVYEIVRRAQQAGVEALRAGVSGGAADEASRAVIRDAGREEGFKHGLGHGVGLEIHEGPSLRQGGGDVIPAGAVVTVEPGIYADGVGGVRIEDMVEVTPDGCRVIPRTTKELLVL